MTEVLTVVETIKSILNTNLLDVWEVAIGQSRTTQVFSNDFRLTGTFPKVQIMLENEDPQKMQWGGKTSYLETNRTTLQIFYYNKPLIKYLLYDSSETPVLLKTYEDGGSNDNPSLNRYMLEQIRTVLIANANSLGGINNMKFDDIVSTQLDKGKGMYWGYVEVSFELDKRH